MGAHRAIDGISRARQGDRHRSEADRPDAALATPARTPRRSTRSATIFAQLPEARARGYDRGRFSFNVKGGRCEACSGDGVVKVEMHFLADVYVPCEVCARQPLQRRRRSRVRYKGKNIADVLDTEHRRAAASSSRTTRRCTRILETLADVGLGYMKIGQTRAHA